MKRCHHIRTSVEPRGPQSWAVICSSCGRLVALVDGPRDEVYASL